MPNSECRREVKWERPSKSYMNLNFDGVSRRNPGRSRVGCVIRDHGGHIKKALLVRLPDGSNNMTEALTLLEVVELAISLGISKLHIEGDSHIITSTIVSKKVVNWDLQYVLGEVWRLLPRFQSFKIVDGDGLDLAISEYDLHGFATWIGGVVPVHSLDNKMEMTIRLFNQVAPPQERDAKMTEAGATSTSS
ncbi:hypothetical protein SUGI_0893580 [Cryptomeria japonica]|nr:hypothetical protein SUGI_0893580 [Cryptomeria japonica]